MQLLRHRRPGREGAVSALEIVHVSGSKRETVWTYSHAQSRSVARDLVRLTQVLGEGSDAWNAMREGA